MIYASVLDYNQITTEKITGYQISGFQHTDYTEKRLSMSEDYLFSSSEGNSVCLNI
jgi:hypothetical protein